MSPTRSEAAADGTTEARVAIPDPVRTVTILKRVDAPPYRVYRAWTSPEALSEWFPDSVEGSLTPGTRSTLVFPDQRVWWEMLEAEPYHRVRFRWPWLPNDGWVSEVLVTIQPRGYGSMVTLEDGPFDLTVPGVLEAYAECLEGWGEALAQLRAVVDYSVDLRRYR
jgi:uncharacterized protein YndB with AHSA1/START domain